MLSPLSKGEGGKLVFFKRLDERFPQRDQSDEMSEVLTEIFL